MSTQSEHEPTPEELLDLARLLARTFIQRWDLYPRQTDDGSYLCIKAPLTGDHLAAHLKGVITLGAYVLDPSSRARFAVLDADGEAEWEELTQLARTLAAEGAPSYLETSRRGGHLWLFFTNHHAGEAVGAFGKGLVEAHGLAAMEFFPKQTTLTGGPGSLIRLPFGVHRKTGQRYGFLHPDGLPLAPTLREQIRVMGNPTPIPAAIFERYQRLGEATLTREQTPRPPRTQSPEFDRTEGGSGPLSERIKAAVTVADFVRHYVDLSPTMTGRCPFHDDHHESFSINAEENYWHCFSGCGGGSIIDFWMKYKDCDFKAAVRELAGMVLEQI